MSFLYIIFLFSINILLIYYFFKFPKKNIITNNLIQNDISISKTIFHSLSSSLGTGNILGVGIVLELFGPGILFWMAIQSILGMFLKFFETYFAIYYKKTINNENVGGPMYYIEKGLNNKFLSILYVILCLFCCFTIGNIIQTKAIAIQVFTVFNFNKIIFALLFVLLVFLSIYKGINRTSSIIEKIVPIMMAIYLVVCFYILFTNKTEVLLQIKIILKEAFKPKGIKGGITTLILFGFLRGTFTNEAGLGSGSIAHGASSNKNIYKESLLEALTPIIDTFIFCTITGLVILVSKLDLSNGELLFSNTLNLFLNNKADILTTILIFLFAFAAIIGWYYYGEKCFLYIFENGRKLFILIFLLFIFISFFTPLLFAFKLSDIATILISLLNFPVLLLLVIKFIKKTK